MLITTHFPLLDTGIFGIFGDPSIVRLPCPRSLMVTTGRMPVICPYSLALIRLSEAR